MRAMQQNKAATDAQITELDKNINITLKNISDNQGTKTSNPNKDIFQKGYKLDQAEKWIETSTGKLPAWRRLTERYLYSGPSEIKAIMEYALKSDNPIDLGGTNNNGDKTHRNLTNNTPKT